MNKDLKKIIRDTAKELDFPIMFYRWKRWECSCCYWPESYDSFINTNNAHNWLSEEEYYKINYHTSNIKEELFNDFVKTLSKNIAYIWYNIEYDFSKEYWISTPIISKV